jgi:tetratricopeptide (TPR) repeat protein
MGSSKQLSITALLIACAVLFVLGRVAGVYLGDNGWSFTHWSVQPLWYSVAWTLTFGLTLFLVRRFPSTALDWLSSGRASVIAAVLLFVALIVLHFDSFFYGAGNLRVAQIAQADKVIIRWFEMGSVASAAFLVNIINAVTSVKATVAGEMAWRIVSYLMTALTLAGAILLARKLAEKTAERISIALLIFFGPHSLILFGYIGPEPVIPAVVVWTAFWIVSALDGKSQLSLLGLWCTVIVGAGFHISSLFLIPAVVFTTMAVFNKRKSATAGVIAGVSVHVVGIAAVYWYAETNLEFARNIIFINGISPETDYGLFSFRHLSDHVQRVFLVFPLALVGIILLLTRLKSWIDDRRIIAVLFLTAGGAMSSFILNPVNSVVADLPRMAAFLAPASILLALLIIRLKKNEESASPLSFAGVIAVFVPLAVLPVYRSTLLASNHVQTYYDQHDSYFYSGAVSFRDAFFAVGNYDKANEWEQMLPVESPQHINLTGCQGLVSREEFGEAVRSLSLMKIRYPYWVEARSYLATIQMTVKRPDLAKADIDTALMIDPFDKSSLVNKYVYFRETGDYATAIEQNEFALRWYPNDTTMLMDQIALYYRRGDLITAERLANSALTTNSTLAFPWLIRALAEDSRNNAEVAMRYYQTFIDKAPNDPDVTRARKRINELTIQGRDEQLTK